MIIHTKKCFAPFCRPSRKISYGKKLSHSSLIHPRLPHTSFPTSKYNSNTNQSQNIPLFPYLGLGLGLGLGLQLGLRLRLRLRLRLGLRFSLRSNKPLDHNRYISIHAIKLVSYYFYFYVLCKYYHTNEDRVVLNNPYSLQLFHTNEDGVVLVNPYSVLLM